MEQRYADALALIHDDGLFAVLLATLDGQHAAQVRGAQERHLPVFVEKPLAGSRWEEAALQDFLARARLGP